MKLRQLVLAATVAVAGLSSALVSTVATALSTTSSLSTHAVVSMA